MKISSELAFNTTYFDRSAKNMFIPQLAFFLTLFISPVIASATDAISPPAWGDNSVNSSTALDPVVPLLMGTLEITMEKTSLKEVQSAIGAGEIYHHGDASEALAWLCFTVSMASPKQRVWLSSGEMGGLTKIDGVTAVEISKNMSPSESCPELPLRFMPLRFRNNIWLETSENVFRKTFGEVKKVKDARSYIYIGNEGEFDVVGSLSARFKNHKSVAIYANHVTSN